MIEVLVAFAIFLACVGGLIGFSVAMARNDRAFKAYVKAAETEQGPHFDCDCCFHVEGKFCGFDIPKDEAKEIWNELGRAMQKERKQCPTRQP